ncbi:hypothetical protein V6N00_11920 [Tersicoccus sp. MR15.9]|uniref:hypothetical protein n=1 Tax=Tersicoccus mangrovi TaxID=3121635 RepID=UPI002FE62347
MTDDAGNADRPAGEPAHPSQHRSRRRLPWARLASALVGLALLVGGVVTVTMANTEADAATGLPRGYAEYTVADEPGTFYTGSYEPSTEGDIWLLPDPGVITGLILAAAGVAVLVFALAWWAGARRRDRAIRDGGSGRRRFGVVPAVMTVLGLGSVVAGLITTATTPPVTFGWFAYAPLSNTMMVPTPVQPTMVVGSLLVLLGVLVLVAVAGWLMGRWPGGRRRFTPHGLPGTAF